MQLKANCSLKDTAQITHKDPLPSYAMASTVILGHWQRQRVAVTPQYDGLSHAVSRNWT